MSDTSLNKLDFENTFQALLDWKKCSFVDKNIFAHDPTKTEIILMNKEEKEVRLVMANEDATLFCRVWGLIQEVK